MTGQSHLSADPDEPLRGVILIPLDGVSVVHGELVMEIVVTFANSDKGSDKVVLGRVLVIEGGLTEPMS